MKGTRAASRYAKALLELAIENNQVDNVLNDMKYIGSVSSESRDFQLLVQSPIINTEKKIAIFNTLFGQFQQLSLSFVELITKKGREAMLTNIAASFEEQVNQYKGITPLTIISAVKLSDDVKNGILSKVQGLGSGTFEITEKIDPTLIGGFIVRTDDKQLDLTVSSQLENLKQRLTR